jgi:molybdate transport system substrate-binding protein
VWSKNSYLPAIQHSGGYLFKAVSHEVGALGQARAEVGPTQNVRASLAAVESGNVEAGFVFKTDALIPKR